LGERRGENWEQSEKLGQEEAVYISYEGGKEFMLADKSINHRDAGNCPTSTTAGTTIASSTADTYSTCFRDRRTESNRSLSTALPAVRYPVRVETAGPEAKICPTWTAVLLHSKTGTALCQYGAGDANTDADTDTENEAEQQWKTMSIQSHWPASEMVCRCALISHIGSINSYGSNGFLYAGLSYSGSRSGNNDE
jgi:hypothetical protein